MSFLTGLLVGLVLASIFVWNPWTEYGTLRIDVSNPEKDLYRFEINSIEKLSKKKRVVLRVDPKADLSQK